MKIMSKAIGALQPCESDLENAIRIADQDSSGPLGFRPVLDLRSRFRDVRLGPLLEVNSASTASPPAIVCYGIWHRHYEMLRHCPRVLL
jgi:hypothetical protein